MQPFYFKLSVLFDTLVENLSSIISLESSMAYKNFIIAEMLNACQKCSELNLQSLVDVCTIFFLFLKLENEVFTNFVFDQN
jgi:hypothetical protein